MSINKRFKKQNLADKNRLNTKFKKIKKVEKRNSTFSIIKVIIYIVLFFIITGFILLIVLYNKYLKPLSVEELKNLQLGESSIMYDRNGKEMFKFYKEKRTYVDYDKISKNMINALVAGEDKRFWENPGFDIIGLIRSGVYFLSGKSESVGGTSTLTQQLIRNTIIEKKANESLTEGIDRKIKEIFLSYQLTKSISKEKIIELYLNKIEFGHNAFGIEEASKTFFNKSAKDLNVFEASVLASLPKGPSYYSPYKHPERLLGYLEYKDGTKEEGGKGERIIKLVTKEDIDLHKEIVNSLKEKILSLKGKGIEESDKFVICSIDKNSIKGNYEIDNKGCLVTKYQDINEFISSIEVKSGEQSISYSSDRNAYILQRMLEDNYISFEEYKNAIVEGFGYQFNISKERIKAPHFVFYVREYLEQKYGKENISTGGLKIYTTLDLELQNKAEEIIKAQVEKNKAKFNAKNSALISIDNKTGGILTMVGSADYFSDDGKGNVNVITSKMQPGSSFKPFVYSLAMQENQLGTKTPVYDVEMSFPGGYTPSNFDSRFMYKMNITTALNYSRNIPAVKMFYMTKGTKDIVSFLHKLGATSLEDSDRYGASLALGTGEMTALDLAKAYTVFANMGEKVEINPILKIVDSKGVIVEENKEPVKERAISTGQAFLLNNILSDSGSRPSSWNKYLTLSGRPVAAKTGTSTKPVKEGKGTRQYPANLWTIGYTPQITTVVWSGNTDGETLKFSGNGLEASGPIWRDFMNYYHKGKEALNWKKPDDAKSVKISEISGYLPNPESDEYNFLVSSYFVNPPKKIDDSYKVVEYDALCNGKITDKTPIAARKKSIFLEFHSLKPDNKSWEEPVQKWAKSPEIIEKYGNFNSPIIEVTDEVCKREGNGGGNIIIKSNISTSRSYNVGSNPIEIAFKSSSPIIKLDFLINGELIKSVSVNNKTIYGIFQNLEIPEKFNNSKVKVEIRAVNEEYFSDSEIKNIYVGISPDNGETEIEENIETNNGETENIQETNSNISNLSINITNPKNSRINIYPKDYFNLRFNVSPVIQLSNVNIFINNNLYKNLGNSGDYVIPINQVDKLDKGINNLKIQAVDSSGSVKERILQIKIL